MDFCGFVDGTSKVIESVKAITTTAIGIKKRASIALFDSFGKSLDNIIHTFEFIVSLDRPVVA